MECEEELREDSHVGKNAQSQLDSTGESCVDESAAPGNALDDEAADGSTACANASDSVVRDHAIQEPKVGMIFETEKAAYDYYSEYGRKVGFCIRWDTRTRSRISGETISRRFLCNKQGFRVDRPKTGDLLSKYHREETRCGCKAFMRIKVGSDGKFHISELYNTHNHELVIPQKVLESRDKKLDALAAEADYRNYLRTRRMNALQKFEAGHLLEYVKRKQAEDPYFFHSFQLDDDEQITNVFWTDGRMRTDFTRFGDVMCFDTTYKTNDYGQPIALFVGVNHHKQLILFGAALLCDATADSFRWLFKTFVEAMGGKVPITILTDESEEILNAVKLQFPDASHRLCIWHLYQNALKNLAHVFSDSEEFIDDFSKCIYDFEMEAEFLDGWNAMLEKYGLLENTWLQQKFNEREMWASVYGKNTFCADMISTQRGENLSKELEAYLHPAKDILNFFELFERLLADRCNRELEENVRMTQNLPYAPPIALVQHAARLYTPAVFKMFMVEYAVGLECLVKNRQYDGSIYILTVGDSRHNDHLVTINITQEILSCSCHKFEFAGILCGHVLTCIIHDLRCIPERYILKRWTRGAGSISLSSHISAPVEDSKLSLPQRYNYLAYDFVQLSVRAAEDEDMYNCAMKHKLAMYEEMEKIIKEKTSSVRIISSGSMFGGTQARNNAIARNFGWGPNFSWLGDSISRNKT
uniref:Protein FAR1-RELATED SEQUENCE n=1 Tax=Anthurium amnicola TaxID=1678845 RepID=A0A1D1XW62_9ARAE